MVRLYYINEFGQIILNDGSLYLKSNNELEYEQYANQNEALEVAERYVSQHPLFSCLITDNEGNERQFIGAPKAAIQEALETLQKERNLQAFRSRKRRAICLLVSSLCIVSLLTLFVLLLKG